MTPEYRKAADDLRTATKLRKQLESSLKIVSEQEQELRRVVEKIYEKQHSVSSPT